MQWIIGLLCDYFMCFYTHHNIGRLYANNNIVISKRFNDVYFVKCAFYQTFGSNTMIFFY